MQSYFDQKMKEREFYEGEARRKDEEIEDWKEATRRARNLYECYKEFAERKNPESNTIEQMAENIYEIIKREVSTTMNEGRTGEEKVYYMD